MANLPSHASPTVSPQPSEQPVHDVSLDSALPADTDKNDKKRERQQDRASPANSSVAEQDQSEVMSSVPASLLSPSFTPPATPGGTLNGSQLFQQACRSTANEQQAQTSNPASTKRPKLLPKLPNVECIVRARIPTTTGTEMFLHLYHNDLDNKEHLAIVFGNSIRSRSLDQVRPGESEMDRMIRGAYVGKLHPGRVSSWHEEKAADDGESSKTGESADESSSSPSQQASNLSQAPLVRIHSECYTGETAWSARCDCGEQLDEAARLMSLPVETLSEVATHQGLSVPSNTSGGVIIYLRQEGRGIGLGEKLKAYNLQDLGSDTVEANLLLRHPADARSYGLATAMLADLGLGVDSNSHGIRLLTNNPDKVRAVEGPNREVVVKERVAMVPLAWSTKGKAGIKSTEVEGYLQTKIAKMGHMLQ